MGSLSVPAAEATQHTLWFINNRHPLLTLRGQKSATGLNMAVFWVSDYGHFSLRLSHGGRRKRAPLGSLLARSLVPS